VVSSLALPSSELVATPIEDWPLIPDSITMWYRRHECGLRMAMFFSAATAAGAFGGLLARAIQDMKNVGNLHAWQWIFILEGVFTLLVGK
jgi:sugar phosphate permease